MMGFGNGMMGGWGSGYGMMGGWGQGNGFGYGPNFASGYGGGYWGTGLLGFGIQLLSLIFLIAIGIAIFRWLVKRTPLSSNQSKTGHPLSIINERYARGEINTSEYINLKKDIFN